MSHIFKNNLFNHSQLIGQIFNKSQTDIIATITKLEGNTDDMLSQFFIELHLPLNHETYKIVNSIGSQLKNKE